MGLSDGEPGSLVRDHHLVHTEAARLAALLAEAGEGMEALGACLRDRPCSAGVSWTAFAVPDGDGTRTLPFCCLDPVHAGGLLSGLRRAVEVRERAVLSLEESGFGWLVHVLEERQPLEPGGRIYSFSPQGARRASPEPRGGSPRPPRPGKPSQSGFRGLLGVYPRGARPRFAQPVDAAFWPPGPSASSAQGVRRGLWPLFRSLHDDAPVRERDDVVFTLRFFWSE